MCRNKGIIDYYYNKNNNLLLFHNYMTKLYISDDDNYDGDIVLTVVV